MGVQFTQFDLTYLRTGRPRNLSLIPWRVGDYCFLLNNDCTGSRAHPVSHPADHSTSIAKVSVWSRTTTFHSPLYGSAWLSTRKNFSSLGRFSSLKAKTLGLWGYVTQFCLFLSAYLIKNAQWCTVYPVVRVRPPLVLMGFAGSRLRLESQFTVLLLMFCVSLSFEFQSLNVILSFSFHVGVMSRSSHFQVGCTHTLITPLSRLTTFFSPEDGGRMFVLNGGIRVAVRHFTVSEPTVWTIATVEPENILSSVV